MSRLQDTPWRRGVKRAISDGPVGLATGQADQAGGNPAGAAARWSGRESNNAVEVDGTIKDMPLMRKWIERVRGQVVTEKPEGVR